MIRLNVSEEQLRTGKGLERVVQQIFWYQIFWKDSIGANVKKMKLLQDMYKTKNGDPIKLNRKKKLTGEYYNLVKPQCDTANRTFIGRVPDIVTKDDDREKERISKFSLKLKHSEFEEEISDVGLQMSITGSGFLALYADIGDTFPRFRSLDPLYTNVVYDATIKQKRLFAYHIYYDTFVQSEESGNIAGRYVCVIYTKERMFAYATNQITIPLAMTFAVYPLNLFWINNTQLSFSAPHGFNDIPIFEFMNNKYCSGDCATVISLIGLYSELMNNRFQNVDDIINYLLVVRNARIGDEKETRDAITLIKENRILPLEGEDADAKFLSNPLNQKDIQTLSDTYLNLIHYTTGIPDFTSVEFTQNASDVIIKAKTKPLLDLCIEKEKWFNRSYIPMLETILNFVETNDKRLFSKIKFDIENIDLVYTHTLPSNETDAVNRIVNLNNAGLLDPRVALQWLPSIPNVDDYIKGMKEYNEYVDKRKQANQNKNNGTNETNLERQNSKVVSKDQLDNIVNANKGISQNISDNKVE